MENKKLTINGIPVDPKLVHKHNIENVIICNLRRPLPLQIEKELLEFKILPFCSEHDKSLLKDHYIKSEKKISEEGYSLNGMNFFFTSDEIKAAIKSGKLSRADFRFFLNFFKKSKKSSSYSLQKNPDEIEFSMLENIFFNKRSVLTDKKKTELSEIFDRLQCVENKNVFYANMIVDINHPYFFEHPNEHVPGMMVIEAVRQLLVACSHKYGHVPLKDYNFVLSSMTGVFKNYLELNYPVLFKVIQTNLYTFDSGIWSDSEFRVHVYQNEQEAAILTFQENILSSRVFKRLRTSKESAQTRQWFVLKKHIEYKSVIRGHGLKKFESQIEYLSHQECIFIVEDGSIDFETDKIVEFFIYFSKIGFVHGTAITLSQNKFGKFSQLHIKYHEMDQADKNNLHEAIKKYGYLLEN
jgi:hypothetical protein